MKDGLLLSHVRPLVLHVVIPAFGWFHRSRLHVDVDWSQGVSDTCVLAPMHVVNTRVRVVPSELVFILTSTGTSVRWPYFNCSGSGWSLCMNGERHPYGAVSHVSRHSTSWRARHVLV